MTKFLGALFNLGFGFSLLASIISAWMALVLICAKTQTEYIHYARDTIGYLLTAIVLKLLSLFFYWLHNRKKGVEAIKGVNL
jgi:hypothetical protein